MLHTKFQSPSIYIDRYFQLFDSVINLVSSSVTGPRCRALHLARGQGADLKFRVICAKSWNIQGAPFYKSHCWVDPVATSFEKFIILPFYGLTWPIHGPSNWFFLDLNNCVQGCFMPNFRFLESIWTDIFNFLTHSVSSQSVSKWQSKM